MQTVMNLDSLELSHSFWKCKGVVNLENSLKISEKVKHTSTTIPRHSISKHLQKRNESIYPFLCPQVFPINILVSQDGRFHLFPSLLGRNILVVLSWSIVLRQLVYQ